MALQKTVLHVGMTAAAQAVVKNMTTVKDSVNPCWTFDGNFYEEVNQAVVNAGEPHHFNCLAVRAVGDPVEKSIRCFEWEYDKYCLPHYDHQTGTQRLFRPKE